MIYFIVWYLTGLIACGVVGLYNFHEGNDLNGEDVLASLILSLAGPVILIAVMLVILSGTLRKVIILKGKKNE